MNDAMKTHGAFGWCELMTNDQDAATAFYTDLLGWNVEDFPMPNGTYKVVKAGDRPVGGIMTLPDAVPQGTPPHWGAYVTVEDVDAVCEKAKQLGATVLMPPTDIPAVGRFCTFRDPQGAVLSVITYVEQG